MSAACLLDPALATAPARAARGFAPARLARALSDSSLDLLAGLQVDELPADALSAADADSLFGALAPAPRTTRRS